MVTGYSSSTRLRYAVGIFLCPAAGVKSLRKTAAHQKFPNSRGILRSRLEYTVALIVSSVVGCGRRPRCGGGAERKLGGGGGVVPAGVRFRC